MDPSSAVSVSTDVPSTAGPSRLPQPSMSSASIDLTGDSDDEYEGTREGGPSSVNVNPVSDTGGVSSKDPNMGSEMGQGVQAGDTVGKFHNHTRPTIHSWLPSSTSSSSMNGQPAMNGSDGQAQTYSNGGGEIEFTGGNITSPSTQYRQPGISPQMYGTNGMGANGHGAGNYAAPPPPIGYGNSPFTSVYPSPNPSANFIHYRPGQAGPSTMPNGNGIGNGPLSYLPLNPNAGVSASSAIDLTNIRIPTPPPSQNPKQPMCIGALVSRAIMLYPCEAAIIGANPPEGSKERYEVREHRGAEFLKVKLKFRPAGSEQRKDMVWATSSRDAIQVTTPALTQYLGDLDVSLADVLMPIMQRGLLRLEGYVQRLHPDAPQFEIRVNVLLFTLPSNIQYISQTLLKNQHYLTHPIPQYEPDRHADRPPYHNPHMDDPEIRQRIHMYVAHLSGLGSRYAGGFLGIPMMGMGMGGGQMDKAKQVEVQRQQVDDVFKSLDTGVELGQCDPGPLIKTDLFPHQRKALTFLLEREADASCLKKCRKTFDKKMEKKAKKRSSSSRKDSAEETAAGTNGDEDGDKGKDEKEEDGVKQDKDKEEDGDSGKKDKKNKKHLGRSLWEPVPDENGKVRLWRNKITEEKRKGKEVPDEGKGAILADDMGLGKTLSIVSLIGATRSSAQKWARSKATEPEVEEETKPKVEIGASTFKNRVFGMPEVESDTDIKPSTKKRKREENDEKQQAARQSRIQLRSKGNLLVCPMSTITNWEDQIKDHWNGKVEIVGGSGIAPKDIVPKKKITKRKGQESSDEDDEDFDLLRVYVYHGSAKINDPAFLSEFDIVITSYNTLAMEYSKMSAVITDDSTPAETADNSDEEIPVLGDTSLNERATKPEVEAEIKAAEVADRLRKAEAKKKGKGPLKKVEMSALQAVEWFRVVLDEAHYIKTAATIASKAACYLAADRRIALTGTPIQNKIEDIWALFKFLRLDPVDKKDVFNEFIWNPCKQGNSVGVAKLQLVMRCCTLRRTKDSVAEDGRKILNLPPRKEMQLWLELREDERKIYDERANAVKDEVEGLAAQNALGKNYAHILQEVLRLRQICNHVDLAMLGTVEEDYDGTIMDYQVAVQGIDRTGLTLPRAQSVVSFRKDGAGAQCESCGYEYNDYFPSIGLGGVEEEKGKALKKLNHRPLLTKCLHMFCAKCFKSGIYPDYKPKMKTHPNRPCSACNTPLRLPVDVIEVVPPDSEQAAEIAEQAPKRAARKKYVRQPGEKPNLSTKMEVLLQDLMKFSRRNPNSVNYNPMIIDDTEDDGVEELDSEGKPFITKSVVFSQWTTMLDRIGDMLDEANIRYDRLDGTMTREDRARAMQALKLNKKVEVLLVSTRAGGVGLNLVTASRAYLVDPYWNPSVEAQAIDRIHRMGQTRPVTAIKFMIKNSIEEKLDKIQKKKANLANLSLKPMTRKELMDQKAEELASLFS